MADYANMSIEQVDGLPYDRYLLYLRDGWLHALANSETGRKFLADLWRLTSTESDRTGNMTMGGGNG